MANIHSFESLADYAYEQIERIERMQRELAAQVGEGVSRDGLVKATTGAAGSLRDLRIDPAALRLSAEELSAQVTSAIAAAQADYARHADDIMGPILGVRPSEESAAALERKMSELDGLADDIERKARARGLSD